MAVTQPTARVALVMGPGPSLMLLKGYEVRDRGGIVFSVAAERLWGLDMIM